MDLVPEVATALETLEALYYFTQGSDPGLGMAKVFFTLLPGTEVTSIDEPNRTVTTRDTTTGALTTFKWDHEHLMATAAAVDEVKAPASNTKSEPVIYYSRHFGAPASIDAPTWLPLYPSSTPEGTMSEQMLDGATQHHFVFKTTDSASKVVSYYQVELDKAGLMVTLVGHGDQGGLVQAEDGGKRRTVVVIVGSSSEGTLASVKRFATLLRRAVLQHALAEDLGGLAAGAGDSSDLGQFIRKLWRKAGRAFTK